MTLTGDVYYLDTLFLHLHLTILTILRNIFLFISIKVKYRQYNFYHCLKSRPAKYTSTLLPVFLTDVETSRYILQPVRFRILAQHIVRGLTVFRLLLYENLTKTTKDKDIKVPVIIWISYN